MAAGIRPSYSDRMIDGMRRAAVAVIVAVALSGCAAQSPADEGAGGGPVANVASGATCMSLPFATELQAEVGGSADVAISTFDMDAADPNIMEVSCYVHADDRGRGISVGLHREAEPCEPKTDLFDPDPELSGGAHSGATNGGLGYWYCAPSGDEYLLTYISGQDVEGPSVAEMRGWALAAAANEDLFIAIALAEAARLAALAEADAPAEGCVAIPSELAAAGLDLPGCVLGVEGNDKGGATVFLQGDNVDTFSAVSDQLEGAGLETVFCEEGPAGERFCGWSGPTGWNANVEFRPAGSAENPYDVDVVEVETWGFTG